MVNAPELSFRGAKRRGNLAVPSRITGYSRRNRNCLPEIAPQGHFLALRAQGATSACGLLAMTNRGGYYRFIVNLFQSFVQRRERHAAPLQWRVRSAGVPPNLQPARRSMSTAADAIGACRFIGSLFVSAALRRARLSAPQLVKKVPSGLFRQAAFRIAKSIFVS